MPGEYDDVLNQLEDKNHYMHTWPTQSGTQEEQLLFYPIFQV